MSVMNVDEQMERITDALSIVATNVKLHNSRGRTDINKEAEDFYCGLLNIVLSKNLVNLNLLEIDFPAIDLADKEGRLCVQVSSTEERNKVDRTLEKFFAKELDKQFDRLIVLIIGEKPRYQRDFTTERGFDFVHERDVWDLPKLLLEIEKLDEAKRKAVDEYLSARVNTGAGKKQYPDLPLRTALEGDAFVGRAEELAEIDRRFRSERVLFLTGLGGMGKTELAVRYAREFVEKRGHRAFLVLFRENLRETLLFHVAPTISGLDTKSLPEGEILRRTVEALNSAGADALLILDNADQANLTALRGELSVLKLKVLVTTRQDEEGALDVAQLRREELHRLFTQHEARVTREEMDALIDAVDGHTLTVDLMARALRPGFRAATAEKLLHNLGDGSVKKVKSAYRGREDQARINEHLRAVFRVLELSDDEKTLLHFATLLPESGMDGELFLQPFEEDLGDALSDLIQGGWLLWKDDLLRIHPVIRLVCIEELKPTVENCDGFLQWFRGQYHRTTYDREKFTQIAYLYETASQFLQETDGLWANNAGYLWNVLVEPQRALSCNQRAVELREKHDPGSANLATAYGNLGSAYCHLGNYEKSLEYELKALEIREQVLPPTHLNLHVSCNNVGTTYLYLGNYEKALEYQLKALKISEQVLPPTHPNLAQSYNNVGVTYGRLGDHENEMEYSIKALEIREQVFPPTHPILAQSYNNIGSAYGNLGNHKKALEYQLKTLKIFEQVLPPTHPDLAGSYNNVGTNYVRLGDHEKALEYQLKALGILEQTLPPDHPHSVLFRNNIAVTYAKMDDFIRAADYMHRALESAERTMRGHPNLEWYRRAAQIMEHCAQCQEQGEPFNNPFK